MNGKRETKALRAVRRIAAGRYMVFFRRRRHGAPQVQRLFWPIISSHYDFPSVYVMDIGDARAARTKSRTVVFRANGVDFRCMEFDCWADVYDMRISFDGNFALVMFASGPERVKEKYMFYLNRALGWDPNRAAAGRLWLDVQLAVAGFAADAPINPSL